MRKGLRKDFRKNISLVIISAALLTGISLNAQEKKVENQSQPVVTTSAAPQLSTTEKLAVESLRIQFNNINQLQQVANRDLQQFSLEIKRAHPGFEFDVTTATLTPIKPEPQKSTPTEKK